MPSLIAVVTPEVNTWPPWLGHDTWVETVHDGFVVWADGGHGEPATDTTPRIHFSRQELADSLSVARIAEENAPDG